jgi:hypothetical protein
MKKILALVTFLVIAAACSTEPPTNRETAANANKTASPATASMSEADATAREKATWDAIKKKDYEAFGNMLDKDYIEVENDGVYDHAGIISYVKDLSISEVNFSDWKVLPIDKDAMLITYNVNLKGTFKGKDVPPGPYHAASAWLNRDGKWLGIYYQETLAKTSPMSPKPASSPAAKSSASPAAKMAEATTGPDPAANEKMVWNAIKSKNYDAFGAFLAPDAIEVEADGVYDKAGSVKGVSMFDASKVELSDWKTVKFDSDASLVTYMVMLPGAKPDHERHTTIWVNRGGKWMAFFHQGTPAETPKGKPEAHKM